MTGPVTHLKTTMNNDLNPANIAKSLLLFAAILGTTFAIITCHPNGLAPQQPRATYDGYTDGDGNHWIRVK